MPSSPPQADVRYTHVLRDDGPVVLRPWQLSFQADHGTKGFMMDEETHNLVFLIAVSGFLTDGNVTAGVEKLSIDRALEIPSRGQPGDDDYFPGFMPVQRVVYHSLNAIASLVIREMLQNVLFAIRVNHMTKSETQIVIPWKI